MYRRTLAAYWSSQPGELKADECIEDIFSGGDGWGKRNGDEGAQRNDRDRQETYVGGSGSNTPHNDPMDVAGRGEGRQVASGRGMMALAGRQKQLQKAQRAARKGQGEVSEDDVMDDLRSWRVGEGVEA